MKFVKSGQATRGDVRVARATRPLHPEGLAVSSGIWTLSNRSSVAGRVPATVRARAETARAGSAFNLPEARKPGLLHTKSYVA